MNNEKKIIEKYFLPLAQNKESLFLKNDAAYLKKKKSCYFNRHDDRGQTL